MNERKTLYRKPSKGKISGVCAGLADYFDLDVTLVRLAFVFGALVTNGFGVVVYIILAVVLSAEGEDKIPGNKAGSVEERIQKISQELKDNRSTERLKNYFGIGLVLLGLWLVFAQLFPGLVVFRWEFVWPAALVIAGLWVLFGAKGNRP